MKLNIFKNAKQNLIFGFINKTILILLPFIERTVMQQLMGELFLGLNSLFSSILSVLGLAEMGFSSAIVYHLYKPVADNDIQTVNALLNYYKKIYRIIGFIVLGIGLILIPFLPHLIQGEVPEGVNIYFVYLLFLCDAVYSYFLYAYLGSLLTVYQREDIRSKINTFISIMLYISKIIVVATVRNYYVYVALIPIYAIAQNLWIAIKVKRKYPQYGCEGDIGTDKRNSIRKLVAGTFISKISAVTRNSLDSICTSAFLGLALTAIYNNYYMIAFSVTSLLGIAASSFIGGIGNHVVTKSVDDNYEELRLLDFFYMMVSGLCTSCMLCLYQPFMNLWMGSKMLLPFPAVILFCLYFYILKLGDMRTMYSTANGLWWHHRHRAIGETVANLLLNIVLGKLFGIYGIISATIISMLFCNFVWATEVTFSHYFNADMKFKYYTYHLHYAIVTIIVCTAAYLASNLFSNDNMIIAMLIKGIICICVSCGIYFIVYRNNPLFIKGKKMLFSRKQ